MNKRKLSLIMSIIIGLTATTTAAVSTYAWFQAEAQVQIQAVGDSTTITVAKPDDYTFYAYNYNGSGNYGRVTNGGLNNAAFLSDFTAITNSNVSSLTSLEGLNPGQSMVYCLAVTGATIGNAVTLSIHTLISNTAIKQGITYNDGVNDVDQHRYYVANESALSGTEINVGWAIDIYTMSSADGSGYSTFLTADLSDQDTFEYDKSALGELNNAGTGTAPNKLITLNEDIEIYSQNATATTVYVFYRVYFSDDSSTFYQEVNPKGANVETTDDNRRFLYVGNNTGTSNCYGGLKFQLTNMKLEF